jgi:hypothetical protein
MKKYLVIGGMVTSRTDGQVHHIDPLRLCQLYGVNPNECVMVDDRFDQTRIQNLEESNPELIRLTPRDDGDYRLPSAKPRTIEEIDRLTMIEAYQKGGDWEPFHDWLLDHNKPNEAALVRMLGEKGWAWWQNESDSTTIYLGPPGKPLEAAAKVASWASETGGDPYWRVTFLFIEAHTPFLGQTPGGHQNAVRRENIRMIWEKTRFKSEDSAKAYAEVWWAKEWGYLPNG